MAVIHKVGHKVRIESVSPADWHGGLGFVSGIRFGNMRIIYSISSVQLCSRSLLLHWVCFI